MTVINLPLNFSETIDKDGLVWKEIIPLDKKIVYGGEEMIFTKDILEQLKSNHEAHILDQTAFQLADDENKHDTPEDIAAGRNWDPQRYRGEIEKLVVNGKGLMGGFKLTDEGLALVKKNKKLGVSASIKPVHVDESGKSHKYVLRHVVGTLNPKIKGMSPWQFDSITLSATDDDNEEVFDLTTTEVPNDTKNQDAEKVTVTKEEWDKAQKALQAEVDGEKLLDEILKEVDDEVEPQPTNLSEPEVKTDPRLIALENQVAKAQWEAKREGYKHAGVPNAMLNLCDDVMSVSEGATINLSDGEKADPREIIHKLLNEAKGTVDLSSEEGHGKSPDEREAEKSARDQYVDGFISEYNLGLF